MSERIKLMDGIRLHEQTRVELRIYAWQNNLLLVKPFMLVIAERDGIKWFNPAKGQFQMYYKDGIEHPEYVPDFVIEMDDFVLMVETKVKSEK